MTVKFLVLFPEIKINNNNEKNNNTALRCISCFHSVGYQGCDSSNQQRAVMNMYTSQKMRHLPTKNRTLVNTGREAIQLTTPALKSR